MGEKQPDMYSADVQLTDGLYHVVKITRRLSAVELYVDGVRLKLDGANSKLHGAGGIVPNVRWFV